MSMETSLLSNALKACINEIYNTQKKDEKSWRGIEKDYLKKNCFSLITFGTCLVAMKVDLFLALIFVLLLGMLIGVDKGAGYNEILKQLATGKFVKQVKGRSRKEKSAVIKFSKPNGKYTVSDDDTSALLYDGKQVCADFIVDGVTVSHLIRFDS